MRPILLIALAVTSLSLDQADAASLSLRGMVPPVCEASTTTGQGSSSSVSVDVFCNETHGSVLALRVDGESGVAYTAVMPGRTVALVPGEFTELAYYVSAVDTRETIELRRMGGSELAAPANVVIDLRPMD